MNLCWEGNGKEHCKYFLCQLWWILYVLYYIEDLRIIGEEVTDLVVLFSVMGCYKYTYFTIFHNNMRTLDKNYRWEIRQNWRFIKNSYKWSCESLED